MRASQVPVFATALLAVLVACSPTVTDGPSLAATPPGTGAPATGSAGPSDSPPAASAPVSPPASTPPPRAAFDLEVRGDAGKAGEGILMAPALADSLYVSIPKKGGSVLALLDGSGRPRSGWPIEIADTSSCTQILPVDDGSVRVVCDATDLPPAELSSNDVRIHAFDVSGRAIAGWPIRLRPGFGRMLGDDLVFFAVEWLTDLVELGQVTHEAWLTRVAANGTIRRGTPAPLIERYGPEEWAIGPDGVAYGVFREVGPDGTALPMSALHALDFVELPTGFPVAIKGIASVPDFDAAGRLHVTVARGPEQSARTMVFDTHGRVVGESGDLGLVASDSCVGIEGTCETPVPPLVGPDGTVVVIDAGFAGTTATAVDPTGTVLAGWPFRSEADRQARGICPATDICEGYGLTMPTLGPGMVLHLLQGARNSSVGGSISAVGPDGDVRAGWPVELRRPGAGFWSVVVGSDQRAHALAMEPESGGAFSATILSIDPDGTVRAATTVMEP